MNKSWKWFLVILGALVVLGVIVVAVFGFSHGYSRMGYFGGRYGGFMMYPGMMGGFRTPGLMIFIVLIRLVGLAIPLGLLGLLVWGVVKFTSKNKPVQTGVASTPSSVKDTLDSAPARVCSHCGKVAQDDWVTCPYCSEQL